MIRPGKLIKASTVDDIPDRRMTVKDRVLDIISHGDYTTNEISVKLKTPDRMVREVIMHLKRTHNIIETKCRCGHTPIYRVKK